MKRILKKLWIAPSVLTPLVAIACQDPNNANVLEIRINYQNKTLLNSQGLEISIETEKLINQLLSLNPEKEFKDEFSIYKAYLEREASVEKDKYSKSELQEVIDFKTNFKKLYDALLMVQNPVTKIEGLEELRNILNLQKNIVAQVQGSVNSQQKIRIVVENFNSLIESLKNKRA
ncbi:hypothetical protein [Mycoplasmopsis sturni]|uniref:hypothetical protein n=1 Tax=Mycoplasmopsis sturni TaxID=39047 RepID=UPI00056BE006|nr:hypothetical protein [Mycoplasmopsis sturni]